MPGLCNSNNTISTGNPQRLRLYGLFRLDFLVHGSVQHERAEVDRTTLVYRDPLTHTTRIVRVQDQL
ncbi:hypothetical protein QF001_000834 [Paraburkholderia youngii]